MNLSQFLNRKRLAMLALVAGGTVVSTSILSTTIETANALGGQN